jgi:predicted nuclease with RNAse H fold
VLTVGIDLAAEAARSAMALIRWEKTVAVIEQLALGATDRMLVEAARPADKVGIDCPLGWPVAFVDFVQRHARGDIRPGEGATSKLDGRLRTDARISPSSTLVVRSR